MAFIPQTLNGFRALSVRLSIPYRGVWSAVVELDADIVQTVAPLLSLPTPAFLTVGGSVLKGTIDPEGSGVFGNRATARVIGGGGGWHKEVPAQHFNNPAGALLSTLVYAATAPLVLEIPPLDPIPELLGEHFARTKGPASRIFGDRHWHVDPVSGVATTLPWLPSLPDPLWTIVDYDIAQKRVSIISDSLILPGTPIVDLRFGAEILTARDIEQTFDGNGSKAEVWIADDPISRLQSGLVAAVREFAGTAYLKTYKYRFVLELGGKLALQAITAGAPDLNPIDQWTGLSGAKAKLTPATEIVVGFVGGDPSQPYLVSFSPLAIPLEIDLAGGAGYLTPALWAIALQAALVTFAGALTGTPTPAQVGAAATALGSALFALPPATTLLTKAT